MLFIGSANGNAAVGATLVTCSSTLNVQVGDILVAGIGGNVGPLRSYLIEDTNGDNTLVSKGTTTEYEHVNFQVLDSADTANATATFDAVITGGSINDNIELTVLQFRPEAGEAPTLLTVPALAESGWGKNPTSNSISSTETDSLWVGVAFNDRADITAHQIAGSAADGVVLGSVNNMDLSYSILNSVQTTKTHSTTSGNGKWGAGIIVFDIAVSAGSTGKSNPLMGCLGGSLSGAIA